MEEEGYRTCLSRDDWVVVRKVQELHAQDEREYAGLLQRLECKDLEKYERCKPAYLALNKNKKESYGSRGMRASKELRNRLV